MVPRDAASDRWRRGRTAPADEVILHEGGSPGDRLCVIRHGEVTISHDTQKFARLTAGGIFGELTELRLGT